MHFVWLFLLVFIVNAQATPHLQQDANYVGSEQCSQCHQNEYQQWQQSHHAKSMLLPSAESVLGDFSDKKVTFKKVTTHFSQDEAGYYITTADPAKGQQADEQQKTYKVAFTFGYSPLQQYLLDIGDGKLQAFDVAWDSRPETDGGQRWFKLLPDEDTSLGQPFHWSSHFQNWNSRCADCHSTNLDKGYDPINARYNTTFSEVNVACESCHGPGQEHLKLVVDKRYDKNINSGFGAVLTATRQFVFVGESPTAQPQGKHSSAQIDACGGCHSRRQMLGKADPTSGYHDQYVLSLLEDPLYHPDGQAQDEVFVLGSFLQSKMHKAGVTCTNCHNAHTGEVKEPGNAVCAQCHLPAKFNVAQHTQHKTGSTGAQCINCHMPVTTYMEVDDRHDHSFSIPRPQYSAELKTPNACNSCHTKESVQWAATTLEQWLKTNEESYGRINEKARKADALVLPEMVSFIEDEQNPNIKRATLLSLVGTIPSRVSVATLQKQLVSDSTLIRRAAVDASSFIPLEHRWMLLKSYVADPVASVRFAVASQLAGYYSQVQGDDRLVLNALFKEYEQQLRLSEDMPAGQLALANYALAQGEVAQALNALQKALQIEPHYTPALLNLVDVYRGMGDENKAKQTLQRATALAPDNGAVQHSLGLYWVRQQQLARSLPYLQAATQQDDRIERYFYVYAVALESAGNIEQAISVLKQANTLWPNRYELLLTLIMYLEKSGQQDESLPYLTQLSAIAPNDPQVRQRVRAAQNND